MKSEAKPAIFHFQPDDVRVLESPEEIKEWEKNMKERVGFTADFSNLSGSCTESTCGSHGSDDCDQD